MKSRKLGDIRVVSFLISRDGLHPLGEKVIGDHILDVLGMLILGKDPSRALIELREFIEMLMIMTVIVSMIMVMRFSHFLQ